MTENEIPHPPIVSREQWLAERKTLLEHEKEQTRHYDRVNAERRRLPMVKVDKEYVFEGPTGRPSLKDLFEGRRQLTVCHFHVRPGVGQGMRGRRTGFVDAVLMQGEEHGLRVFFRIDDDVFHTYSAYARGTESLTDAYRLLDMTPYGRQQEFEDSPAGWPQHPTYG